MSYFIVEKNTLIFDKDFDSEIDEYQEVMLTVKHIKFGNCFNSCVDNLPPNIETIHFGDFFNQPVDNLPNNIKGLTFGTLFNQSVDFLPGSLQYLELGEHFNKSLDNLPTGLTILILHNLLFRPIDNLPRNLKFLCISSPMVDENNNSTFHIKNLPMGLTHLMFGENNTMAKVTIFLEELPESVIFLVLNVKSFCITNLPTNLVYLHLGKFMVNPIKYPKSLKYLAVNYRFMIEDDCKDLPDGLEYIEIKNNYCCRKFDKLPKNLKKIICKISEKETDSVKKCYGKFCVPVDIGFFGKNEFPDAEKYYNSYPFNILEFIHFTPLDILEAPKLGAKPHAPSFSIWVPGGSPSLIGTAEPTQTIPN